MTEYLYKGLIVSYTVIPGKPIGFQADGCIARKQEPHISLKTFQTAAETALDAESEIKRLIENYLDFEFDQSSLGT